MTVIKTPTVDKEESQKTTPKPVPASVDPNSGKPLSLPQVGPDKPHPSDITCCGGCLILPPYKLLIAASWVAATSLATYGIQDTVLNIPGQLLANISSDSYFHRFRSELSHKGQHLLWGVVVGSLALGAMAGSAVAVPIADYLGRKLVLLYVANAVVCVGSLLMFMAHAFASFEMLLGGRVVLGFAVGLSTVVLPMYLMELSATANRGFMGSLQGVGISLFSAAATGLGMPGVLGNEHGWGWLLSFQAFFAVAMVTTASLCPESPQYLYVIANQQGAAKEVADEYCSESYKTLKARWELEKKVGSTLNPHGERSWPAPLKEAIALSVCIGVSRAFSGVTVWNTYSSMLLQSQGVSVAWSNYLTVASNLIVVFSTLSNSLVIDRIGRRVCFLGGLLTINIVWLLVFILWLTEHKISNGLDGNWTEVARQVMLELIFSMVNPLATSNATWFLASELVPESVRAMITGISMVALWTAYLVSSMLYPILESQIQAYTILALFVCPSAVVWVYLYAYLPETSKRSFVDIYEEIGRTTWRTVAEKVPYDPEYEYAVRKRLRSESKDWPVTESTLAGPLPKKESPVTDRSRSSSRETVDTKADPKDSETEQSSSSKTVDEKKVDPKVDD